jgi:hypothetical protein
MEARLARRQRSASGARWGTGGKVPLDCRSGPVVSAGCQQKGSPDIMAGKPFIVLHNVDADCVRQRLLTRMTAQAWKVRSDERQAA